MGLTLSLPPRGRGTACGGRSLRKLSFLHRSRVFYYAIILSFACSFRHLRWHFPPGGKLIHQQFFQSKISPRFSWLDHGPSRTSVPTNFQNFLIFWTIFNSINFMTHRLSSFEPRDDRVVFVIQQKRARNRALFLFCHFFCKVFNLLFALVV